MSEALVTLGEEIKAALPGAVTDIVVAFDEITVLARGEILAQGSYRDIADHPGVREAYLGV